MNKKIEKKETEPTALYKSGGWYGTISPKDF